MSYIYAPTGKAREYSPLALNIYTQCDHGCRYCYVPSIKRPDPVGVKHRLDFGILDKEAAKAPKDRQVLLCFMTDPYCHADIAFEDTRKTLQVLLRHQLTVAILTKGGRRLCRDLDLITKFEHIKVGATLTFTDEGARHHWEPESAPTPERIEVLRELHDSGIRTWASIEPVIDPEQSLSLIRHTLDCVDEYKVGKLNHLPEIERRIDWRAFGQKAIGILEGAGKSYYVKEDLARHLGGPSPPRCISI